MAAAGGAAAPSGWNLSTASYASKSFSVAGATGTPLGLCFSNDGTKVCISENDAGRVYSWTLSTAWDISTAGSQTSLDISGQSTNPRNIRFSADGTKFYVLDTSGTSVYQYSLSTAWSVSSGSYASKSCNVAGFEGSPTGIHFSPDGTKLYVVGTTADKVGQYNLSTVWDISTALYSGASHECDVSARDGASSALFFSPDGTKMYVSGTGTDSVYQYSLTTAFDPGTATYATKSFSFSGQESAVRGMFFSPDGTKMFAVGNATDTIYQYSVSA